MISPAQAGEGGEYRARYRRSINSDSAITDELGVVRDQVAVRKVVLISKGADGHQKTLSQALLRGYRRGLHQRPSAQSARLSHAFERRIPEIF
jgi:hypothetical protein